MHQPTLHLRLNRVEIESQSTRTITPGYLLFRAAIVFATAKHQNRNFNRTTAGTDVQIHRHASRYRRYLCLHLEERARAQRTDFELYVEAVRGKRISDRWMKRNYQSWRSQLDGIFQPFRPRATGTHPLPFTFVPDACSQFILRPRRAYN